jgi:hypothetical protein
MLKVPASPLSRSGDGGEVHGNAEGHDDEVQGDHELLRSELEVMPKVTANPSSQSSGGDETLSTRLGRIYNLGEVDLTICT